MIEKPKLPAKALTPPTDEGQEKSEEGDKTDEEMSEAERKELERLHSIGIPVPGIEVRVDKMKATVWLETLEVEGNSRAFEARVKAVVERAVDVIAPLWG